MDYYRYTIDILLIHHSYTIHIHFDMSIYIYTVLFFFKNYIYIYMIYLVDSPLWSAASELCSWRATTSRCQATRSLWPKAATPWRWMTTRSAVATVAGGYTRGTPPMVLCIYTYLINLLFIYIYLWFLYMFNICLIFSFSDI